MEKPSLPPHDTRFGYLGISLTKAKVQKRWRVALNTLQAHLEPLLIRSGYLHEAPFSWVTLAIRYGEKSDIHPTIEPINKEYGDLSLGIEVDVRRLIEGSDDEIISILERASLIALIEAGRKYERPVMELERLFANRSGFG